jgi:hypothetical protein
MRHIRKILAFTFSLVLLSDLREWFLGHFQREVAESSPSQEYQVPDDHSHSENSQPAPVVQMASLEIAPPSVPFVPDDDSQMYGAFLLPQRGQQAPNPSYMMESDESFVPNFSTDGN